jgi:hypothetical protein
MSKILLASASVLVALLPAHADYIPKFNTFQDYSLSCESMASDRRHVTLDVLPGAGVVKLHNWEGKEFEFGITRTSVVPRLGRNQFGNEVYVPVVMFVFFKDNVGQERMIMGVDKPRVTNVYVPGPSNTQSWGYSCVPSYKD